MSDSSLTNDWSAANQRLMVAELAALRHRLGGDGDASALANAVAEARAAMPAPAAIDVVAARVGLTSFERDVLLLCAGMEMDSEIAAQCRATRGDLHSGPTFAFALATLDEPHWSALAPVRPLRRWRLLELDEAEGVTRGRLRIDERVLHYLAGVNYVDPRLRSLIREAPTVTMMSQAHEGIRAQLVAMVAPEVRIGHLASDEASHVGRTHVALCGDDGTGQVDVATAACADVGRALYVLRGEDVPTAYAELDALVTLWEREVVLLGATLLVDCHPDGVTRPVARLLDSLSHVSVVATPQPSALLPGAAAFVVDRPSAQEQRRLWRTALGAEGLRLNGAVDTIAAQFRLSARAIAVQGTRFAATPASQSGSLWTAVREASRSRLGELAQRIDGRATWEDLVLPELQRALLRAIAAQVRNRLTVHGEWGFDARGARGLGITALFAGESGTGKTMAAEVLAHELELDLYRIDLSSVVSKYIGETEKNLRRVFDAAEESGAILLFDEADALFGKRSEVKDSHDRYANIEVSYLLQRMEAYRGLAILTTNLRGALDAAFQRRLRFVVPFPFPDAELREAIWRREFPSRAPVDALDYRALARLHASGGSIRNIALNAAFSAADARRSISMVDILRAAHQEAGKRERPLADAETRGWVP